MKQQRYLTAETLPPVEYRLAEIKAVVDDLLEENLLDPLTHFGADRQRLQQIYIQRTYQKQYLKDILRPSLLDELFRRDSTYWTNHLAIQSSGDLPTPVIKQMKKTYYRQVTGLYRFADLLSKDYKRLLHHLPTITMPSNQPASMESIIFNRSSDPLSMLQAIVDVEHNHLSVDPTLWLNIMQNPAMQCRLVETWAGIDRYVGHCLVHQQQLRADARTGHDSYEVNEFQRVLQYNHIKQLKKLTRTFVTSWQAMIDSWWYCNNE